MRPLFLAALAAAIVAVGTTAAVAASSPDKRVLLIFAQAGDPGLQAQKDLLAGVPEKELAERDLLVLHVRPNGQTTVLFGDSRASYSPEKFGAYPDRFSVVLVGKDGGVKWREDRPAHPDELFRLIDSMPMRAIEMRRNGDAG